MNHCLRLFTIFPGWILIDRSGKYFGVVLNFLRDGNVPLPDGRRELLEVLQEAKYYLVQDLVNLIEATLKRLGKDDVEPICRIPLVTSQREEQSLISTTVKVSIIIEIFPSYSYAPQQEII